MKQTKMTKRLGVDLLLVLLGSGDTCSSPDLAAEVSHAGGAVREEQRGGAVGGADVAQHVKVPAGSVRQQQLSKPGRTDKAEAPVHNGSQ